MSADVSVPAPTGNGGGPAHNTYDHAPNQRSSQGGYSRALKSPSPRKNGGEKQSSNSHTGKHHQGKQGPPDRNRNSSGGRNRRRPPPTGAQGRGPDDNHGDRPHPQKQEDNKVPSGWSEEQLQNNVILGPMGVVRGPSPFPIAMGGPPIRLPPGHVRYFRPPTLQTPQYYPNGRPIDTPPMFGDPVPPWGIPPQFGMGTEFQPRMIGPGGMPVVPGGVLLRPSGSVAGGGGLRPNGPPVGMLRPSGTVAGGGGLRPNGPPVGMLRPSGTVAGGPNGPPVGMLRPGGTVAGGPNGPPVGMLRPSGTVAGGPNGPPVGMLRPNTLPHGRSIGPNGAPVAHGGTAVASGGGSPLSPEPNHTGQMGMVSGREGLGLSNNFHTPTPPPPPDPSILHQTTNVENKSSVPIETVRSDSRTNNHTRTRNLTSDRKAPTTTTTPAADRLGSARDLDLEQAGREWLSWAGGPPLPAAEQLLLLVLLRGLPGSGKSTIARCTLSTHIHIYSTMFTHVSMYCFTCMYVHQLCLHVLADGVCIIPLVCMHSSLFVHR